VANVEYGEIRWAYTIGGDGGGGAVRGRRPRRGRHRQRPRPRLDQPSGHLRWTYDAGGNEEYGGGAWGTARPHGRRDSGRGQPPDQPDPDPGDREAYTHRLLALEAADGSVRWESGIDDVAFVGPVVHESTVVVATRAGGVHGVALDSGERRWRESAPETWAPLVHDEDRASVYVADTAGAVTAFDPASGEQRWQRSLDAGVGAVAMAGSDLFVEPRTAAYGPSRATDGETQWTESSARQSAQSTSTRTPWPSSTTPASCRRSWRRGAGIVGTRFSVTESRGSECGWNPDGEWANGLLYDGFDATVSGRWSLGNFDADAE